MTSLPMPDLWKVMTGTDKPEIRVIAEGLARVPRWLNRMSAPWSVAQHLLVCDSVAAARGFRPEQRLATLLHDMEEMVVGDTPKPAKTDEQERFGDEVRRYLYKQAIGMPYPDSTTLELVHEIDCTVAVAEAAVLGHPRLRACFRDEPDMEIVDRIWSMLDMDIREQVHLYTTLVEALLVQPTVRALRARV